MRFSDLTTSILASAPKVPSGNGTMAPRVTWIGGREEKIWSRVSIRSNAPSLKWVMTLRSSYAVDTTGATCRLIMHMRYVRIPRRQVRHYQIFGSLDNLLRFNYDDVIKWKHFPRYWPFVRGIHRSPVNSPHKGQCRGALMFSLICIWMNGWINNRYKGDLKSRRADYDVTKMPNNHDKHPHISLRVRLHHFTVYTPSFALGVGVSGGMSHLISTVNIDALHLIVFITRRHCIYHALYQFIYLCVHCSYWFSQETRGYIIPCKWTHWILMTLLAVNAMKPLIWITP